MKLKVDQIEFNLLVDEPHLKSEKVPIVFLHGFTGCASDWSFIFDKIPEQYYPVAIDMIGHGQTESPDDQSCYTCGAIVHQINAVVEMLGIKKFVLAGYSLGGRAAISYSLKYPHKIAGLILESSTAGIEDISERKTRVENDFLLSDSIKEKGIEWFTEFWLNLPLFSTLKSISDIEEIRNIRSKNNVIGLSNMLAGFSTGLMSSYWNELYYLDFPVLLLCGELDEKYTLINRRMSERFRDVQIHAIEKCGHNTHLEKPELFTKFVVGFLNSI